MKNTLSLIALTYMVGYKSQRETKIEVSYHIETVPNDFCPDLLGDTVDKVIIDSFDVEGLDVLSHEFSSALDHLKMLVSEYIRLGDQKPMTGQVVFDLNSDHWHYMSAWFQRIKMRRA